MRVDTISSRPDPERTVALCARGDYYDGYVGEDSYETVMENVALKDKHLRSEFARVNGEVPDQFTVDDIRDDSDLVINAKTRYRLEDLIKARHWGPFEHVSITFGAKGVSRALMAQLTRHRHASFDVQSMRYADFGSKDEPVVAPASLVRDEHFTRHEGKVDYDGEDREELLERWDELADDVYEFYDDAVDAGMPKEDARGMLPVFTKVNMTFTTNLRTLMHIANMRAKNASAQWEIQEFTNEVIDEAYEWAPRTMELFEDRAPFDEGP